MLLCKGADICVDLLARIGPDDGIDEGFYAGNKIGGDISDCHLVYGKSLVLCLMKNEEISKEDRGCRVVGIVGFLAWSNRSKLRSTWAGRDYVSHVIDPAFCGVWGSRISESKRLCYKSTFLV